MRKLIALCLLCLTAYGCGSDSSAIKDCYSVGRYKKLTQPSLDVYWMNVKAANGTRIDLYGQMPYERLRFVLSGDAYSASYTVSFLFLGKDGDRVQSKEVTRTVSVRSYAATTSAIADAFLQSVTLPPGVYTLECTTIDQNSLVRYVQRSDLTAPDFAVDSVMASSMLLLLKSHTDEQGTVLHPLFPQTVQYARDSIGVFQEIYGALEGDSISIGMTYRTLSAAQRIVPRSDNTMVPPYSRYVGTCSRGPDSVAMDARTVILGHGATVPSIQFYPAPPSGFSEIERTVSVVHNGKTASRSVRMSLFRNESARPVIADIVDAMRYITDEDEFDSLRTPADSLRAGALARFWEEHGGVERQREFERRVDEANSLFSVCVNGSRTPMGITYIVCGPPEYVECRGPYTETWFYAVGTQVMSVAFRVEQRNEDLLFFELPLNAVDDQLWSTFISRWRKR